jgi:lipopolysaccharide export system protein LptA
MIRSLLAGLAAAALAFSISSAHAVAQQPAAAPAQAAKPAAAAPAKKEKERSNPLGNIGANNKEPIKIDSDRLDVYDKEQRAVFQGNVVAVQGDTTIRCTTMTVFYERQSQGGQKGQAAGQKTQPAQTASQNDSVKQIDCAGPVTVVSKDQIATSDNASFDRAANKVVLTGNAALSQCQNVTRGEKIVYDLNTQVANVETAPGGRVRALFVPNKDDDKAAKQQQGCQQPETAGAPAQPQATAPTPAPTANPQAAAPAQAAAPKPAQKQRAQATDRCRRWRQTSLSR